jgi:hypothetical protein
MGGYGSGRRSSRPTTDECIRISLANLKQLGMLNRHCLDRRNRTWSIDGRTVARSHGRTVARSHGRTVARSHGRTVAKLTLVADVHCSEPYPCLKITGHAFGRRIDCLVSLDSSPMRFGGERWYALCPNTGRRCTSLVLPPGRTHFASVRGWGRSGSAMCGAIDEAEGRLRALSKCARKPTRERLVTKSPSRAFAYRQGRATYSV